MTLLLNRDELTSRLKAVICPVCTDRRGDGSCGLENLSECPIDTHLQGLVYTAATVNSGRMDRYESAVRKYICSECRHRTGPVDRCDVQLEGHCALDAYLMPALDVVDDVIAETKARAGGLPDAVPAPRLL